MFATPFDTICAKVFPSSSFPYPFRDDRKVVCLIFSTNMEFYHFMTVV